MVQFREVSGLEVLFVQQIQRAGLKNMSSLERESDYREFGLERLHCTTNVREVNWNTGNGLMP